MIPRRSSGSVSHPPRHRDEVDHSERPLSFQWEEEGGAGKVPTGMPTREFASLSSSSSIDRIRACGFQPENLFYERGESERGDGSKKNQKIPNLLLTMSGLSCFCCVFR